jgi:hypothetical protein
MRLHFAAVKSRLLEDAALADKGVYDSALVDSSGVPILGTYSILFGGAAESLESGRLTGVQSVDSDASYSYTVRCVSVSPDGVRAATTKVLTQLVGFAPTVEGRNCSPIVFDFGADVRVDNSVNPPLFYADSDFVLASSPTS